MRPTPAKSKKKGEPKLPLGFRDLSAMDFYVLTETSKARPLITMRTSSESSLAILVLTWNLRLDLDVDVSNPYGRDTFVRKAITIDSKQLIYFIAPKWTAIFMHENFIHETYSYVSGFLRPQYGISETKNPEFLRPEFKSF